LKRPLEGLLKTFEGLEKAFKRPFKGSAKAWRKPSKGLEKFSKRL
jgi:hypothetical protein